MADDILDLFLDDDLGDDITFVAGGKKQPVSGGAVLNNQNEEDKLADAENKKSNDLITENQYEEDAVEIKKIATEELSNKIDEQELAKTDAEINTLTEESTAPAQIGLESDEMKKRYNVIIEAYFKDLRDALETKSKLVMPIVSGGMGFSEDQAEKLMESLRKKRTEYETTAKEQKLKERDLYVSKEAERQLNDSTNKALAEKLELDNRYRTLVGEQNETDKALNKSAVKTGPAKMIQVQGADDSNNIQAENIASGPKVDEQQLANVLKEFLAGEKTEPKDENNLVESKNIIKDEATIGPGKQEPGKPPERLPIVSEEKKPIIKTEPPVTNQSVKKDNPVIDKPKPVFPKPPVLPTKKTSTPTPAPTINKQPYTSSRSINPANQTDNRPVVSDVEPISRRLVGPVQELKAISLKDFRRLSRDPKEAILKIKDKVDLLQEQSFETKTAGINAWRESDVNKKYLEILRRSLEGVPVMNVIAEMEKAGEDVLTKPEFDAIMKLNRELRFG